AVLRSVRAAGKDGDEQALLAWRGLDTSAPSRHQLNAPAPGMDDTLMISSHYAPRLSKDGRLAFGLRPLDDPASQARRSARAAADCIAVDPEAEDSVSTNRGSARRSRDVTTVQIWHSSDVRVIPQQQVQANARSRRTLLA